MEEIEQWDMLCLTITNELQKIYDDQNNSDFIVGINIHNNE